MFTEAQSEFAGALLDPERPVPAALTSHTTARPIKRFAVYRNNVVTGLIDVLMNRFPACIRIVGNEFLAATAHAFVVAHPPRSPLLMTYGDDFPDFLDRFPPAQRVPYLADVARLEVARTRAYHAADATPIDPARLQALAPEALAGVRLTLHPSAEIVRSRFPIVTIWAMNSGEAELGPIADWTGQDALVVRPALAVEVRQLPPGGAVFLLALRDQRPLALAAEAASAASADFDLIANLAGLIGSGLVVDVVSEEPA